MADLDLRIQGAEKLDRLAQVLRATGDGDLRRELQRGLQQAVKPVKAAVKKAAIEKLPARGGLNRRVARSKISGRTKLGRDPSVRIVIKGARDIDMGKVRHPVFGNRKAWVAQKVRSGVLSDALEEAAPAARREIDAVIDRVAADIERKVR